MYCWKGIYKVMVRIYFVRHAQPKFSHHEDLTRPLTNEGKEDSEKVFKANGVLK